MSNSIWKTPDIKPTNNDDVVFFVGKVAFAGYYEKVYGEFVELATGECYPVDKWAIIDDLIAQADKAERLQKAVDLALNWLHTIATAHHPTTTYYNLDAQTAIDEIKQLIKGE